MKEFPRELRSQNRVTSVHEMWTHQKQVVELLKSFGTQTFLRATNGSRRHPDWDTPNPDFSRPFLFRYHHQQGSPTSKLNSSASTIPKFRYIDLTFSKRDQSLLFTQRWLRLPLPLRVRAAFHKYLCRQLPIFNVLSCPSSTYRFCGTLNSFQAIYRPIRAFLKALKIDIEC